MQDEGSRPSETVEIPRDIRQLRVSDAFPADVQISVVEGLTAIRVRVTGERELVRLHADARRGLYITGTYGVAVRRGLTLRASAKSGGDVSVWVARGPDRDAQLAWLVREQGVREVDPVDVAVEVPPRTKITIEDKTPVYYRMGDLDAPLELSLDGSSVAHIEWVKTAKVSVGNARVAIAGARARSLDGAVSKAGQLIVYRGKVENLWLTAWSGEAVYGGSARSADLFSDAANVLVYRVQQTLHRRGSGVIDVRFPPEPYDSDTFWS